MIVIELNIIFSDLCTLLECVSLRGSDRDRGRGGREGGEGVWEERSGREGEEGVWEGRRGGREKRECGSDGGGVNPIAY